MKRSQGLESKAISKKPKLNRPTKLGDSTKQDSKSTSKNKFQKKSSSENKNEKNQFSKKSIKKRNKNSGIKDDTTKPNMSPKQKHIKKAGVLTIPQKKDFKLKSKIAQKVAAMKSGKLVLNIPDKLLDDTKKPNMSPKQKHIKKSGILTMPPKKDFKPKSKIAQKLPAIKSGKLILDKPDKLLDDTTKPNMSPKQKHIKKSGMLTMPKKKDLKLKSKIAQKVAVMKSGKLVLDIPDKLLGNDGKVKWSMLKEEKKILKEKRKTKRGGVDQYQMMVQAKALWEKLRDSKNSAEKKEQLVNELFMLLKSQIPSVVYSHDMARVVQWMLKLGSASVRTSICEALCTKDLVTALQSKYASFCVRKALRYGSDTDRKNIIHNCQGHFLKLLNHSYSHRVIELMYSTYANAETRKNIHREIYGEMHALLPADVSCIEDIPDNLKSAILVATKNNLIKLLSKKQLLKSTLLQSLLKDFLSSCTPLDCNEILELIQGDIIELLNSKEGTRVALKSVWHATNKMKKAIVKKCKGRVKEIATSEFGHLLFMALFDCIDDTVLIKKILIPELLSEVEEVARNEWGRKVILYLVAHRDPAYFHPRQMEILTKGDSIGSRKKDVEVRREELLEAVSVPLLEKITEDPALWLGESSVAMVSLAVLKTGKGAALESAYESVVTYMLDPSNVVEVNNRQFHIVEHSALHLVFKKLIQLDQAPESFAMILASRLTEESLKHILQFNRGCFLLVLLFESNNKNVGKVLKSKINEEMNTFLQEQETTGSKILLKKLKGE